MFRFRKWYLVLLGFWAILVVPGWVGAMFYAGGYSPPSDWPSLLIDVAFIIPLALLPLGLKKRTQ